MVAGSAQRERGAEMPEPTAAEPGADERGVLFFGRRTFILKTVLLAVTTVALIPVLLLKDTSLAMVYIVALIVVHVVGAGIIAIGVRRHHIAPDRRGLLIRLAGITVLTGLLYLATKGLDSDVTSFVFWGTLFAIWALHTLGLALLHLRSRREQSVCPFV